MSTAPVTVQPDPNELNITQQAQQMPDAAQPPQAPQAAPQPPALAPAQQDDPNIHGWRAVLKGALSGLENHLKGAGQGLITGGIPGAVVGAISPGMAQNAMDYRRQTLQNQQQQQQAQLRFTNAEAGHQVADALLTSKQMEQMPEELRLRKEKQDFETLKGLAANGVPMVVVPHDSDPGAILQGHADANGGEIGPLIHFHIGDATVGVNPEDMAGSSATLDKVNLYQKIVAAKPFASTGQLKMRPDRVSLMQKAENIMHPTSPGYDKELGMVQQYNGYIKGVELWPDSAEKTTTLQGLKDARDGLQAAHDKAKKDKISVATDSRVAAVNARVGDYDVNGVRQAMHAGDAVKAGAVSGTGGEKVRAKQAQFQDVMSGIDSVDHAIGGLETEQKSAGKPVTLPKATIAALTTALRVTEPKILSQIKDSIGTQQLSPAQRDFAVSILQLNERALSLRNIAGQGQGSDSLRAAVAATLPDAKSGDTDMMRRKLAGFRNFTQNLQQGIQRLPGQTSSSGTPAATSTPAQSQFTHLSASGKFGWDGSKWVPTGK